MLLRLQFALGALRPRLAPLLPAAAAAGAGGAAATAEGEAQQDIAGSQVWSKPPGTENTAPRRGKQYRLKRLSLSRICNWSVIARACTL